MQIISIFFVILFFLAGLALIFFAPGIREFNYKSHQRGLKRFGLLGTILDRYPGPWAFRLFGAAMIVFLVIAACVGGRSRDCSWISQLNPDVLCRITDSRDGRELVEYFNIDTNELKLYIRQNGHDQLIEHPDGRVKTYHDKIDENTIKFNPADENTLLVNGEVFPIGPIRKQ
jgi:hypothetical protein